MRIECCKSYVGKGLIGLLPDDGGEPSNCLYYSEFIDTTGGCFNFFWDFEGCVIDFYCLASLYPSGYFVQDGAPLTFDGCSHLTVFSTNYTTPPDINYINQIGNPASQGWVSLCKFGCVKTTKFGINPNIDRMNFCNISIMLNNYGGPIDFNDIASAQTILFSVFSTYFPTCTGVDVIDEGGGYVSVKFYDIYWDDYFLSGQNAFSDGILEYVFNLSTC